MGHLAPGAAAQPTLHGGDGREEAEPVISAEMRAHWEEHGWVLVPDAVPKENLEAVIADIFEFIGGSPDAPESWYATTEQEGSPVPAYGQGSMVQMFQTQALWDNRQSPRVYRAFAELYGREEMSVSIDRANLKPPQRPQSPGWGEASAVHWDMPPEQLGSPKMPDTMRIQGVLYLADTPANGGGFQCVSGFHHRFEEWVETVAPEDRGKNFEQQPTLKHLKPEPIAGKAGDLVSAFLPRLSLLASRLSGSWALGSPLAPRFAADSLHPGGCTQSGTRSCRTATLQTLRMSRGSHNSSQ